METKRRSFIVCEGRASSRDILVNVKQGDVDFKAFTKKLKSLAGSFLEMQILGLHLRLKSF